MLCAAPVGMSVYGMGFVVSVMFFSVLGVTEEFTLHWSRMTAVPLVVACYSCDFLITCSPPSCSPYSQKSVTAFLRDVLDGYYPLQYKESHPDGVIFDVTDKRQEFQL